MKKYIKEHLAVKIFILTAVLLFAVSGFIYGMVAFGVSKSYLAELDESLDESTKNLITQLTQVSCLLYTSTIHSRVNIRRD